MKRAFALAVPLASLMLVAAACGDDDDDDTPSDTASAVSTTVTDATDDTDLPGGGEMTIPDLSLPGGTLPGGGTIPDLSDITLPDVSIPENAEELIAQFFPKLTDEQVSCLADSAGDLSGGSLDPSDFTSYLSDCDVDPTDLLPG